MSGNRVEAAANKQAEDVVGDIAGLVTARDWMGAIRLARHHLRAEQEDAMFFIRAAGLLSQHNYIDAADAFLEKARDRWPENVWTHHRYADLGTQHRDFDIAKSRWRDMIALHPASPLGLCGLADLHRRTGRESDAARLFEEAAARYPDWVWAAHGHAVSASSKQDWPEAAQRWAAIRERFPDHLHGPVELVRALIADERLVEAGEAARLGLIAFPEDANLAAAAARIEQSMRESTVEFYVESAFHHLLQRKPGPDEGAHWVKLIRRGMPERDFFRSLVNCDEYKKLHVVVPGHPPGSYSSPVVNPSEVMGYWRKSAASKVSDITEIPLDLGRMQRFWKRNASFMKSMAFAEKPGGPTRYYLNNHMFMNGDALVLAGMINQYRPRRIIEIGSGFSSAVMLDAIDRIGLRDCQVTFIDPNTNRLRSLLRAEDQARITVIGSEVQDVPVTAFEDLEAGDILFIDSSHVMKTGSDLHYELFHIIPTLKPGVIIHIHDIHFPFEYPESWVMQWSLNEIYVVRAFLAYNNAFRVIFFTDLFLRQHPELMAEVLPGERWPMKPVTASSIWIERH